MLRYTLPLICGFALATSACGKKTTPADPAKVEAPVAAAGTGPSTPAAADKPGEGGDEAANAKAVEAAKTIAGDKTAEVAASADAKRITGPIAKVNGTAIDSAKFYEERDKITARGAKIPADRLARIEQNILKRLVEQELIDQAVKKAGIAVPADDIKKGFDEYKTRFQSDEQFQNYLKHGRVTKESIEQRISDRRALELLLEAKGDMAVTDAEAQEFYGKNERFYTEKAGVRASHVLIKVPQKADDAAVATAMEKVKKAQDALAKGEDFGEVAKRLSEGPSAPKGGDLGFFGEGRMVKEFQEAAFAMKVGDVSKEPVRTRFGFHIIKVTDKREERKKTFDEVKEQIMKSLKNKKFFTERRKLLADLEKSASVERFLPDPPPAPKGAAAPADDAHGHGHEHAPGEDHGHDH